MISNGKYSHMFAVLAYGESKYLEECILSLKNQQVKSEIIMTTSTPNETIYKMSQKYEIPLYVNSNKGGIGCDWNFAYKKCNADLVTLAHQDDIYEPWFVEETLREANEGEKPLIIFTDYGEIRNEVKINQNNLLRVKRILLQPLRIRKLGRSIWIRRRLLSIGSPISCPTVTYMKKNLPEIIFQEQYKGSLDWQAWEKLSRLKGEFRYCNRLCMYHRIHEDSTTTKIIANKGRSKEDLEMFSCFWPYPIARIIAYFYHISQKSNTV